MGTRRAGYGCRPSVSGPTGGDWNWVNGAMPTRLPRLSQLKNYAIFADVMSSPSRVRSAHADGVNVLYADGSARWVPLSAFKTNLDLIGEAAFSTAQNGAVDAVWLDFDRQ